MKLVTAVLAPHGLAAVQSALRTFGVHGLTISEALVPDRCRPDQLYRGQRFAVDLRPQIRLDVLAHDNDVCDLVHIIFRVAAAHSEPDKIWVTPVESIVRVRTGERGIDAL